MLHSSYLCVRLRLYTQKGRTRLDNLLAKMGVSRNHAKQAWTHTPRDLKKSLKEKLEKVESVAGLELVQGKTFERAWGYKGVWAANDVVQVIEATLVTIEETGKENIIPGTRHGDAKEDNPVERFRQREGEMKMEWVTKFWKALDAIDKFEPPYCFVCSELIIGWIYFVQIYPLQNFSIERFLQQDNPLLKNELLNLYDHFARLSFARVQN
jgi:hypothetical protein